ncbi:MAG TPA: ATP-dependent helicase, partial [Candidatus Aminicenantes bacterium]|nr:ATP-dependent helicase [Candidatus Aminicenantes bacterium]
MILRPYQVEAKAALNNFFRTRKDNPCIVLPTGSGKSVVMASQILDWKEETPCVRGCILAHRQELVVQNAEKLQIFFDQAEYREKI